MMPRQGVSLEMTVGHSLSGMAGTRSIQAFVEQVDIYRFRGGQLRHQRRSQNLPQRRAWDSPHPMDHPGALEWQHPLIEELRDAVSRDRQVDHLTEPFIREGDNPRVTSTHPAGLTADPLEPFQIDGLSPDLHKLPRPPAHPHHPAVDLAEVLGEEPAVALRIDQSLLGHISGE